MNRSQYVSFRQTEIDLNVTVIMRLLAWAQRPLLRWIRMEYLYRHLQGNVVFNETRWNLTELEEGLPRNPVVNRRLIFEEYWMDCIERGGKVSAIVGSISRRENFTRRDYRGRDNVPPDEVRRPELFDNSKSKIMPHAADGRSRYNSTRTKQVTQAPVTSHGKNGSQVVPANATAFSKVVHVHARGCLSASNLTNVLVTLNETTVPLVIPFFHESKTKA